MLEKSDKCVGKRMRGRIVLDKKRIISNVWQLLGLGTPSPVPAAVAVAQTLFKQLLQRMPTHF